MKIQDKPIYCSAWCAKGSNVVQCNTIPCCGFSMSKWMEAAIKREGSFKDYHKTGLNPLSYGDNKLKLDPDADGKQWIYNGCFIQLQEHPILKKYCVFKEDWSTLDACSTLKECKELINNYHWVTYMLRSKERLEKLKTPKP